MNQPQSESQIGKAALWMTGAIASFSAMAVAGRQVSFALDTFEIMMYRSVVGVLVICALLTFGGNWHKVSGRMLGTHFLRNAAHFTGQNLWFYAVTVIPLAQVFALEFTSPLWVIILSPLFLGERMTKPRVIAGILGFVGILLVARPDPGNLNIGVVTAASSAVFFALTAMFTKRLTRKQEVIEIMFWLTTMQLALGILCAGIDGDVALPDAVTAPWLILIGFAGLLAHFCLTSALSVAPATVVVPIDFARLPVIAVIGMLLYDEPLDLFVFAGAALIFGGNYYNILSETRAARRAVRT
ncbi:MAG: EamA family transporter [Rhodobacteraceae bacterium]|nr:EamA family transporter [Paracoccaceae bacterium]